MPRRRMLDPDFWNDSRIKRLSPTERLFFIGMLSQADDEGRLLADSAYLRSKIFPYDNFSLKDITSMRDHIVEVNPNVHIYQNAGEEYLYFRKWTRYQKPSHPQPSKLPEPPEIQESVHESLQESVPELIQPQTGTIPSQVRSGQVRSGKVSLGKSSEVQEDFMKFLNLDDLTGLTDYLTRTLTEYLPARPNFAFAALHKLWRQGLGKDMNSAQSNFTRDALKKYSPAVLAEAYAKAVKYQGGRAESYKYLQTILEEKAEKAGERNHSP